MGPTVGTVLTTVIGLGLLAAAFRWFFSASAEKFLLAFEEQGWFSAVPYKKLQGQKVRRLTVLGILGLVGAGVWTLISHNTLARGPEDWKLDVPFTGTVLVKPGDEGDSKLAERREKQDLPKDAPLVLNRYEYRKINDEVDPKTHVKIDQVRYVKIDDKEYDFKGGEILSKADYNALVARLKERDKEDKGIDVVDPEPAYGTTYFESITLLPAVQYTLPLLLMAVAGWLAYRIVNLPVFADFLIATEAEMNKVSWTTRKRLFQDTLVVLATMFLMAFYLFFVDQVWSHVLSWRPIGVIQLPEEDTAANKNIDRKPW